LILAVELKERHSLDEVIFCPAYCSPFKTTQPPRASAQNRLKMLELALEEIPSFWIWKGELQKKEPSFTIESVKELKKENPNDQFYLLLGEDGLKDFPKWKNVKELIMIAPPLIGTRLGPPYLIDPAFKDILNQGFTWIPAMDISSSFIRERLLNNQYCGHLLPSRVLSYILAEKLYTSTQT
jgi:nicotinate-nucleotide adenylyltransferase